ncbi:aldolase [Cenococcum geophilum 1.58]|uniref:aldolase n=1 Tax=Cenococcum geophilum 1.58 TaxID=794803 RepID=UPI00358E8D70|nr:aldolase [Cenococcum geophilum 1.58]
MPINTLKGNKTTRVLEDAEKSGYGVIAAIVYNIEHIIGCIKAAEQKRSPLIIQVFPWVITFSNGLLVHTAAEAASRVSVPISVHSDYAQDEAMIRYAAGILPFDSTMVGMSHYEKAENLAKIKKLAKYCYDRGIATKVEPGRIGVERIALLILRIWKECLRLRKRQASSWTRVWAF